MEVEIDYDHTWADEIGGMLVHALDGRGWRGSARWSGWRMDGRPDHGIYHPGEVICINPDARLVFRRDDQRRIIAVLSDHLPAGEGVDPHDTAAIAEAFARFIGENPDYYRP